MALLRRTGAQPRRAGLHAEAPRRTMDRADRGHAPGDHLFVYYRNLLPTRVAATAPLGAYNLHGSLLPAYRGRAPVNWMLVNGEREAGVTLHHMVARADAGDIVAPARGPRSTIATRR